LDGCSADFLAGLWDCVANNSPVLVGQSNRELVAPQRFAPIEQVRDGTNYSPFCANHWEAGEKFPAACCKSCGSQQMEATGTWRKNLAAFERRRHSVDSQSTTFSERSEFVERDDLSRWIETRQISPSRVSPLTYRSNQIVKEQLLGGACASARGGRRIIHDCFVILTIKCTFETLSLVVTNS
jgi:hypothetical protein